MLEDVRLVRLDAGSRKQSYLLFKRAEAETEGWGVIDEFEYENGTGKIKIAVSVEFAKKEQLGPAQLLRLDYQKTFSITELGPGAAEYSAQEILEESRLALLCVLSGVPGAPNCSMKAHLSCDGTRVVTPDEGRSRTYKGAARSKLDLTADGVAIVTPVRTSKDSEVCSIPLLPHQALW